MRRSRSARSSPGQRPLERPPNRVVHGRVPQPSQPLRQLADAVVADEEGHQDHSGYTVWITDIPNKLHRQEASLLERALRFYYTSLNSREGRRLVTADATRDTAFALSARSGMTGRVHMTTKAETGATFVRLYEDHGEVLKFCGDEFDFTDCGGHLPHIGDIIVDSGVTEGMDRMDPANRRLHEVVARYLMPRSHMDGVHYTCLVVKSRNGCKKEVNILPG